MSQHPTASPFDMNTVMAAKRKVRKTLYKQKNVIKYIETIKSELKERKGVSHKDDASNDMISGEDEKKNE